jgi:hypothetical protein
MDKAGILVGSGILRSRARAPLTVHYTIRMDPANRHAYLVEFAVKPAADDGEIVHLTLEDGRVIQCQVLDESPYCSVVGDGPVVERRSQVRSARNTSQTSHD